MDPKHAIDRLTKAGWTYERIAEKCGTTRMNVWRIQNKGQRPGYDLGQALRAVAQRVRP